MNILYCDYVDLLRPEVHVFGRDKDFNLHHIVVINFKPYFFVNKFNYDDVISISKELGIECTIFDTNYKAYTTDYFAKDDERLVIRVETTYPSSVKAFNDALTNKNIKTYEADILFKYRFIIDNLFFKSIIFDESKILKINNLNYININDIRYSENVIPSFIIMSMDIEVLVNDSFPSYKNPVDTINAISFYNNRDKTIYNFVLLNNINEIKKFGNNYSKKTCEYFTLPIEYTEQLYTDVNNILKQVKESNERIELIENNILKEKELRYTKLVKNIVRYCIEECTYELDNKENINSIVGNKVKKVEFEYTSEIDLLNDVVEFLAKIDYDYLTAYNGDNFDFPYFFNRLKKLKIDFSNISPMAKYDKKYRVFVTDKGEVVFRGKTLFDSESALKKLSLHDLPSYKLHNVSKSIFNVGKYLYDEQISVVQLYKNSYENFKIYNILDTLIEYSIVAKKRAVTFFYFLKTITGCDAEDAIYNSRMVDMVFLSIARKLNLVLPTKIYGEYKEKKGDTEKISGAVVIRPKIGIIDNVVVLDIGQAYPSAGKSFNLGAKMLIYKENETLRPDIDHSKMIGEIRLDDKRVGKLRVYIDKSEKGIIAVAFTLLSEIRKILKNKYEISGNDEDFTIQEAFKYFVNSVFGVLLFILFRIYNEVIASLITFIVRNIILTTIHVITDKIGLEIVYGDTDSIYYKTKKSSIDEIKKEAEEISEIVNSEISKYFKENFNVDNCYIKFEFEKFYGRIMFKRKKDSELAAKKNYSGMLTWYKGRETRKLDVKGMIRSDIPKFAVDLRNYILRTILNPDIKLEDSIKLVKEEIKRKFDNLKKLKYEPSYIAFPKGIGQELSEYGNQDWIRGARWFNENIEKLGNIKPYGKDDKPKFIYIDKSRLEAESSVFTSTDIAALDENDKIPEIVYKCLDIKKTIKSMKSKILEITELIGIDLDSLTDDNITYKSLF
jgi:DNA polymerase elongation subunit (family B)